MTYEELVKKNRSNNKTLTYEDIAKKNNPSYKSTKEMVELPSSSVAFNKSAEKTYSGASRTHTGASGSFGKTRDELIINAFTDVYNAKKQKEEEKTKNSPVNNQMTSTINKASNTNTFKNYLENNRMVSNPILTNPKDITFKTPEQKSKTSIGQGIDNFVTNIKYGNLAEEELQAWYDYRQSQKEEDRLIAEQKSKELQKYLEENENVGQGNALTNDFASYLPQLKNQIIEGGKGIIGGGLLGALTGAGTGFVAGNVTGVGAFLPEELVTVPGGALYGLGKGAKAGYVTATAKYGYEQMSANAYKTLLEMGVPNDVALEMSRDEGIISGLIEGAGAVVDVATAGLGSKLVKGATKEVAEATTKEAMKQALKKQILAKYGSAGASWVANILAEGEEEALQEMVSIGTEKKAYDYLGQERNVTPEEDKARIDASRQAGRNIALIGGMGEAGVNLGVNAYNQYKTNKDLKQNTQKSANIDQNITQKSDDLATSNINNSKTVLPQTDTNYQAVQEKPSMVQNIERNFEGLSKQQEVTQKVNTFADSYGENGAKSFLTNFNNQLEPEIFDDAFRRIYQSGKYGLDLQTTKKINSAFAEELGDEVTNSAYYSGVQDAKLELEINKQQKYTFKNGGLVENEVTKNLSNFDKRVLKTFGEKVGLPIEVFYDSSENAINGEWQGDRIRINIAGDKPVLAIAGHEIGHQLKKINPTAYAEAQKSIVQAIMETNNDGLSEAFIKIKAKYQAKINEIGKNANINEEYVMEEITSDVMGYLLNDEVAMKKFVKQNRTTAQQILDIISDLIEKVRNSLKGIKKDANYNSYADKLLNVNDLEALRTQLLKAINETNVEEKASAKQDTKYSLKEDDDIYTPKNKNISDINTGYSYGESYYVMQYEVDDKVVGTLEYGVYEDEPNIKMIEVAPEYRRKGIGKQLLQELQYKYDGIEISFGMTTPDGTKLIENVTEKVKNPEFNQRKYNKIKKLETEIAKLDKEYEAYNDKLRPYALKYREGTLTEQEHEEWHDISVEQNEIKYELDSLNEKLYELHKKTPENTLREFKTFVKQDTDTKYSLKDSQGNELTKEQQEYFKDSKVRDENGRLKHLYHGTATGEFYTFDKDMANVESDWGAGIYLTDDEFDVEDNYEDGGPDFDNKIGRLAEQIEYEEEIDFNEAKEKAREQLYKGSYRIEAYANIQNPAIVGKTLLFTEDDFIDANEDAYYEDIDYAKSDYIDNDVLWELDNIDEIEQVKNIIYEAMYNGGIEIEEFKSRVNELYLEDERGILGNEVARKIIENLGYDGIIDPTVSSKFERMNMSKGTTHYIVFNSNQIKNIDNLNPTDSDDIRFSLKEDSLGNELSQGQKKYFKNSKVVDENGNLLVMYHGTNAEFNIFEHKYMNKNGTAHGKGFYFSSSEEFAKGYGDVKKTYLNITKPLKADELTLTQNEMIKFLTELSNQENEEMQGIDLFADYLYDGKKRTLEEAISYVADFELKNSISDADVLAGLLNVLPVKMTTFYEVLKNSLGYDGILYNNFNEKTRKHDILNAVVFNSNQVKNIDNLNPTDNPDMRYSLKEDIDIQSVKELKKENALLKAQKEKLLKQFQTNKGQVKDIQDIKRFAREILKSNNSKMDANELTKKLDELYKLQIKLTESGAVDGNGYNIENFKLNRLTEEIFTKSEEIADNILNEIYTNEGELRGYENTLKESFDNEVTNEILNRIKGTRIIIPEKFKDDLGGSEYVDFLRSHFGNMRLVKDNPLNRNNGVQVDSFYTELRDDFGDMLPDVTNETDQILELGAFIDNIKDMKQRYKDSYKRITAFEDVEDLGEYVQELRDNLTIDVLKSIYEIKDYKSYADKQQEQRNKLLAKIEELQHKVKEAKVSGKWDEAEQKFLQEWLNAKDKHLLEEKANEKISKLKAQQRERVKKIYEKKYIQKTRQIIAKNFNDLHKMVTKPTEKQHVPTELVGSVSEFLGSIDFTTDKQSENKVLRLNAIRSNLLDMAKKHNNDNGINPIDETLVTMSEKLDGKRIVDMNASEIEMLDTFIKHVKAVVYNTNRVFLEGKRQATSEITSKLLKNIYDTKKRDKNGNIVDYTENPNEAIQGMKDLIRYGVLTPNTFFNTIGSEWKNTIYNDLKKSERNSQAKVKEVQDYMIQTLKILDDSTRKELGNAKPKTYKVSGKTIELTKPQIMSLYLLDKREQAQSHIYGLGITASETKYKDGLKTKKMQYQEPVRVSKEDVNKLINELSEDEKQIADRISQFLNTKSSEWINEISRELYGYEIATTKDYFPIITDKKFFEEGFENFQLDPTISSWGALKQTKEGAVTPLILGDIFDVTTEHLSRSITYNSYARSIDNVKKIINFRNAEGNRIVENAITRKGGNASMKYLKKLMVDLQGGVKQEVAPTFVNKLISNSKLASVGLNIRSAIQQPTSIMRAMADIDAKYLVAGLKEKGGWQEALKHSEIAQWKNWGHFDTNVGKGMKSIMFDTKEASDYYFTMQQSADNVTWGALWNACKSEIKDTRKDLEVNSKEFFKAVADRFDEIIDDTQVVDTTLARSDVMRQKDTMYKISTAYMMEPLKTLNTLTTGIIDLENARTESDKKLAKKKIKRSAGAVVSSIALNSLVLACYDTWRKKDDDEDEFKDKFLNNFWDNINPLNFIPFIKDLTSMWEGYDIEMMQYRNLSKVVDGIKNMGEWIEDILKGETPSKTLAYMVRDIVGSTTSLLGIPADNVMKEVENISRNYVNASDSPLMKYKAKQIYKNVEHTSNRSLYYDILFEAYLNKLNGKDDTEYKVIREDLIDKIKGTITDAKNEKEAIDKAKSYIDKSIEKNLLEKALEEKQKGNEETFKKYANTLISHGVKRSTIDKAIEELEKK